MRLVHLRLRRAPGLPKGLDLEEFGPGINVLIGPNESGKTTICRGVLPHFKRLHLARIFKNRMPTGTIARNYVAPSLLIH